MALKFPSGEVCRYDGSLHPLVAELPHYGRVPKGASEQAAYRLRVRRESATNVGLQRSLMQMCAADPLFFINTFCYLWEPRKGEDASGILPFNSWANQDPVIASIAKYLGERHMVGDKSRAQGASWIMVALFVWMYVFHPNSLLGIGSKDENSADDPTNPESLGWKIDFTLSRLPSWMQPKTERKVSTHTWVNKDNGSYIKAYAATAGIGRGGRFLAFFLDESAFFPPGSDREAVANLVETTNSVIMISTPHGMDNEHYDRVHKPGPWLRLILDWKDNPSQRKGMYTTKHGVMQCLDPDYEYDDDFKPVLDERIRSPWYDGKCEAHGNDMLYIAQELDREYSGSKGRPFPQAAIDRCMVFTRPPLHTGMLFFEEGQPDDISSMSWVEGEGYKFDLWVPIDGSGLPPAGKYVIGCDISAGVGGDLSSNSVMSIFNSTTGEMVGELAINTIPPVEFAQLSVAVSYWFGRGEPSTYLAWEKQGPGVPYTNEIIQMKYPNVYFQPVNDDMRRYSKRSDKPGYHNSNRMLMLTPLIRAITVGSSTFRSKALLEECGHYVFGDDGKPDHPRRKTARDGSSRGESHGDRAIAAAMAIRAMNDRPDLRRVDTREEQMQKAPKNSIAGRAIARVQQSRNRTRKLCNW